MSLRRRSGECGHEQFYCEAGESRGRKWWRSANKYRQLRYREQLHTRLVVMIKEEEKCLKGVGAATGFSGRFDSLS